MATFNRTIRAVFQIQDKIKPQKLEKQNSLQFILAVKAIALRQQIRQFCPQILLNVYCGHGRPSQLLLSSC